ncbi:MAG: nitroreductase family protein [Clostridia bacterium]|nr:nitroreductase family protein [Clostridia bacterium]
MNINIENPAVSAILKRRTIRSYTENPLPREAIEKLLECAMWAPSGRNSQACHVRVLTDKKALDAINTDFKNLVGWDTPAYTRWDTNPVYQGAPALFFIFAATKDNMNGGIMVENIAIAAESMGLGSCIIASVGSLMDAEEGKKWKKLLGVPEEFQFVISIAVGEKAEEPEPKERKPENFRIVEEIDYEAL